MNSLNLSLESYQIIAGLLLILLALGLKRLNLSLAKHPSLAGHSKMSRRVAKLIPFYEFKNEDFFNADHAPHSVIEIRQKGFENLTKTYQKIFKKGYQQSSKIKDSISDMQFTSTYRVPFQFSNYVNQYLKFGNFAQSSLGVTLTDLDDNIMYDLGGSYGVNVFGNDFYKNVLRRVML